MQKVLKQLFDPTCLPRCCMVGESIMSYILYLGNSKASTCQFNEFFYLININQIKSNEVNSFYVVHILTSGLKTFLCECQMGEKNLSNNY